MSNDEVLATVLTVMHCLDARKRKELIRGYNSQGN
jgi:hypothetical protein